MSLDPGRLALAGLAAVAVAGAIGLAVAAGRGDARRADAAPAGAAEARGPAPGAPSAPPSGGIEPAGGGPGQMMRPEHADAGAVVAAISPLPAGARVRAAVRLDVEDGYHVNANPPTEDWLIPTEVTLGQVDGVRLAATYYPAPIEKEFAFYTGQLKVWEGEVVLGLLLEIDPAAASGDRTLEFAVRYQACNDDACFAPVTDTIRLPVTVAPAGTPTHELASPLLARAPFPEETERN